jgi:hypothetical protein
VKPPPKRRSTRSKVEPVFIIDNGEGFDKPPSVSLREQSLHQVYRDAILELVECGMPLHAAIEQVNAPEGVVDSSVLEEARVIETRMEANLVRSIVAAAQDRWQAAAWVLERRFPERWGKNQGMNANVEVNIASILSSMSESD